MNSARTAFFDEVAQVWDDRQGSDVMERIQEWCATLPIPPRGIVIDLGCGTGVSSLAIAISGERRVLALDRSIGMLQIGKAKRGYEGIVWVQGDAAFLPMAPSSVDAVVALHMLPHVDNWQAAFAEWRRVLKPEGSLFIAHLSSRARINEIHRSGPSAVQQDRLPPVRVLAGQLVSAGFCVLESEDSEERYTLHCARTE